MRDLATAKAALRQHEIELPSWAFGNTGTAAVREEAGLEPDPVGAYQRSGYAEKIVAERTGGAPAGWGA